MKIMIILAILALMGMASAETIQFGNYTANFDMKQPHIIDGNTIRTYYGYIIISKFDTPIDRTSSHYIGDLQESNNYAFYHYIQTQPSCYAAILTNMNEAVISTMNLTSTLDFLKTLKIEKRT